MQGERACRSREVGETIEEIRKVGSEEDRQGSEWIKAYEYIILELRRDEGEGELKNGEK